MRFMNVVARLAFGALVLALVIGIVASVGTRVHIWDFRVGLFKIFPVCLGFGAAALLLGLVWVVSAMLLNSGTGARYGVVGFVGAIILLINPVYDIAICRVSPRIHDISTDVEHPPEFVALLAQRPDAENPPDYDGPNVVQAHGKTTTVMALQKKFYPEIHPVGQLTSPDKLFARATSTARNMGWDIVAIDPDAGRIEATDTSFFFGLTSDIVIRVKPSGMGARLDIRSKSRVGETDGGTNAALIRAYVKKLIASG